MKKSLIIFLAVICLIVFIVCACTDTLPEIPEDAVIIDGAEIYRKYAVLPLCDVIEALGFELTRNGDSASFICNNIEYVISITEKTLTKVEDTENYLICPPGNTHYVCETSNGDLMIDNTTLNVALISFLDPSVTIIYEYDRANNRVAIIKK